MSLDLTAPQLALVQAILAELAGRREVWVFGSRVQGRAKPFSDLDLALVGEQPLSLAQLADLGEAFRQSDLPFRVDLVDWASASPAFQEVMRQGHVVIWPPGPA